MPERVITNIEHHGDTATVTLDNGDTLGMLISAQTSSAVGDLAFVALEAYLCRKPFVDKPKAAVGLTRPST